MRKLQNITQSAINFLITLSVIYLTEMNSLTFSKFVTIDFYKGEKLVWWKSFKEMALIKIFSLNFNYFCDSLYINVALMSLFTLILFSCWVNLTTSDTASWNQLRLHFFSNFVQQLAYSKWVLIQLEILSLGQNKAERSN